MPRYNKILFSKVKASFPALTFYNEIIHTVICVNEHFYNLAATTAELHIFHYITFCFETKNALDFHLTRFWCPGQDSNLHELMLTTPSKKRVYQFHHLGLSILEDVHSRFLEKVCKYRHYFVISKIFRDIFNKIVRIS